MEGQALLREQGGIQAHQQRELRCEYEHFDGRNASVGLRETTTRTTFTHIGWVPSKAPRTRAAHRTHSKGRTIRMFAHESPQRVLTPSGACQQHRVQIALALDDISTRISTAAATEGPPLHAAAPRPASSGCSRLPSLTCMAPRVMVQPPGESPSLDLSAAEMRTPALTAWAAP
ncbi:hypothetical protein EYF80_014104 [Liparis tanakae]|uniref:Uncharacterized protein n=1 Tax=Liparis tanakae TaxID=230148 RepID=A0A4Z2IDD3_9TELE|nr:hypothetical protein EYF80_014104 [Liparis tanakae]